mmetsp:Transcript_34435/g.67918  ORF Transcript_34435/g.67918 Transcript_34435/m.67918 type:complete len:215 (+) Transcript_34435:839-1483(+)
MNRGGCWELNWLSALPIRMSCSALNGDGASGGGAASQLLGAATPGSALRPGAGARRGARTVRPPRRFPARIMFMASMENSSKYVSSLSLRRHKTRRQVVSNSGVIPRICNGISPRILRYRSWSSCRADVKSRSAITSCSSGIAGNNGFACTATSFRKTGETRSPNRFRRFTSSSFSKICCSGLAELMLLFVDGEGSVAVGSATDAAVARMWLPP